MITNLDMEHFTAKESLDMVDDYLIKSNFTPSEVIEKTNKVIALNNKN